MDNDFFTKAREFARKAHAEGATNKEINDFISSRFAEMLAQEEMSRTERDKGVAIQMDGKTYLVNPYTGEIIGEYGSGSTSDSLLDFETTYGDGDGAGFGDISGTTTQPTGSIDYSGVTETGVADYEDAGRLGSSKNDVDISSVFQKMDPIGTLGKKDKTPDWMRESFREARKRFELPGEELKIAGGLKPIRF